MGKIHVEETNQYNQWPFSCIKTIVVLTEEQAETPLRKQSLLDCLKIGGYAIVPITGLFGGSTHLYAVFNMNISTVKYYCELFKLSLYIFSELSDDGIVHSKYREKRAFCLPYRRNYKKKKMDFVILQDESNTLLNINKNQELSVAINSFYYQITFSILERANNIFKNNIQGIIKKRDTCKTEVEFLDWSYNRVGMPAWLRRKGVIKGFYDKQ